MGFHWILPKMHHQRCVILEADFGKLNFSKKHWKKAKHFKFSINQAFDLVIERLKEFHKNSFWLYVPYEMSMMALQRTSSPLLSVLSIEVWDENDQLIAGELGYCCGAVYTSMTGFYSKSGAGTIQMHALARYMFHSGIELWDLGMSLEYKTQMGAHEVSRLEFLRLHASLKSHPPKLPSNLEPILLSTLDPLPEPMSE
jgi:Leu/Phe-tRNA-protein transferase